MNPLQHILIWAVRLYRLVLSPAQVFLFGATGGCRFTPTCSQFALEAVREHGALAGTVLAAKRICRCHPWGGCGHDPVPESGTRMPVRQPCHPERKMERENMAGRARS